MLDQSPSRSSKAECLEAARQYFAKAMRATLHNGHAWWYAEENLRRAAMFERAAHDGRK